MKTKMFKKVFELIICNEENVKMLLEDNSLLYQNLETVKKQLMTLFSVVKRALIDLATEKHKIFALDTPN